MNEELPALSETQLEIMEVVWEQGRATVGEIWTAVSHRRPVARNTVLTLVERLAKKGWLVRHDEGPVQQYSAAQPRKQTLSQIAKDVVNSMFAGSPESFLLALFDGRKLSAAEVERINQLIAQARRGSR